MPEGVSDWPPYTLDKWGNVKGKRLTKKAGHMLLLLDEEAVQSAQGAGSVTNSSFNVGDAVEVKFLMSVSKERPQTFTGIVVGKRNRGINSSFTVRNVINGVPVERSFPTYLPLLQEVNVIAEGYIHKGKRKGKRVRRAKLNYLRDRPLSQSTVQIKLTKAEKAKKLKARMKMKDDRKKKKKKK